jgi:hypothetical protein
LRQFNNATLIDHLRLRVAGADPLVARLRAAHVLETAELRPARLPPAAILCVRTLRDPLPGRVRLDTAQPRPDPLWQQALTARLDDLALRAARPLHGGVPASAQAVLFADQAELLACLALDWLGGSQPSRWWWRALLPQGRRAATGHAAVTAAWLATPPAAPAALHHLARQGQALPFVQTLPDATVQQLLAAVVHAFGLAELHRQLGRSDAGSPPAGDAAWPPGPWQPWTPELAGARLAPPQAALLGVALGLQRAPGKVRTAGFAAAAGAWLAGRTAPAPQASQVDTYAQVSIAPPAMAQTPMGQASKAAPGPPAPSASRPRAAAAAAANAPANAPQAAPAGPSPAPTATAAAPESPAAGLGPEAHPVQEAPAQHDLPARAPLADTALLPAELVEIVVTGFGGAFYLVNVAIYLGLYADFTAPLTPGLDLDIYDFVALAAQGLAGQQVRDDPLWPLLARLAGRSQDEPPGAGFAPPGGLSLDAWLDPLSATMRQRLGQALGVAGQDPAALSRLLLAQPARVLVAAARLDVFFALDQHPVEIRLSGLDRDPGWVPAAGRTIAFHYD